MPVGYKPVDYERLERALGVSYHPLSSSRWAVKRYGAVISETGVRNSNPAIIRDGSTYMLYHTRRASTTDDFKIVLRTSADGIAWSSPLVVMTRDMVNGAGYNVTGVYHPTVIKERGKYYLFFAGGQLMYWGKRSDAIFLATSNDGVNFSDIRMVIKPEKDSMLSSVWHPWVVKFKETYYMYCLATDDRVPGTRLGNYRIAVFTSKNLTDWRWEGFIAMEGAHGDWDGGRMLDHALVSIEDKLLVMVYAAESVPNALDMKIGIAYSFDGVTFIGRRQLLVRASVEEAKYIADASILYEGGKLKIWYEADDGVTVSATGQSTVHIMYAEAVPSESQVMELLLNRNITTDGITTDPIDARHGSKTFWLKSDQSGTMYIQAYDEATRSFADIDSVSVSANVLARYQTTLGARLMRLRFVPTAAATVSAWVLLE
jgi:predicted GH43/DUF377 family glycosyl hydrolase